MRLLKNIALISALLMPSALPAQGTDESFICKVNVLLDRNAYFGGVDNDLSVRILSGTVTAVRLLESLPPHVEIAEVARVFDVMNGHRQSVGKPVVDVFEGVRQYILCTHTKL